MELTHLLTYIQALGLTQVEDISTPTFKTRNRNNLLIKAQKMYITLTFNGCTYGKHTGRTQTRMVALIVSALSKAMATSLSTNRGTQIYVTSLIQNSQLLNLDLVRKIRLTTRTIASTIVTT